MADRVKGITVEIGGNTTGLSKALRSVNAEIRNTQSNLKDVERLLKLDPTNTELLRQKQQLLSETVEETKKKLDSLREAEKQVQKQFEEGKVSRENYDKLQREIIDTEQRLVNAEKAASDFDEEVKNMKAAKEFQEVEDAVEDVEEALEDAGKEASNFKDYLKADALVEGAKGILSGLKEVAEETKEYNKIMGSLENSSERAGYTAEETTQIYKTLYGVLADDQSAATTTANLQAIRLSQEKLTKMTNAAIGAWSTYGDSIPIDGLAEAINHTSQLGEVQGTLSDVLEWGGVSVDDFNTKLAECADAEERANLILQQLTDQGLTEAGEAWQKNNEALVENNLANADMQEQMGKLGETVMPILTEVTSAMASLLSWFNSLSPGMQKAILIALTLAAGIGSLSSVFGNLGISISDISTKVIPALSKGMSFIASNPIVLLIAAIVGLVTLIATKGDEIQGILQKVDDFLQRIFLTDWREIFGPGLGDILNGFFANLKNIWDSIKLLFDGIIDFIRGVFTGDWERAWNGVKKIFSGIFGALDAIVKAPLNGVIGLLNGAISAVNSLIKGFNKIGFDMPTWLGGGSWHPNIPTIPNIPYLATGGVVYKGSAIVGEAGPELLTVSGGKTIVQPLTGGNTSNSTHLGGVNIYIYAAPGQNVEELAALVSERIGEEVGRRGAVYA
mgnify:CR=1 FL=1